MLTATINSLVYVEASEQAATTPLGEAYIDRTVIDSFVVRIDIGELTDHPIWLRPEALGNRIANYGPVTDPLEAVEAVVKEVVFSWSPSLTPADPANLVDVNGGIDDRIEVVWARGVKKGIAAQLDAFAERIQAAVDRFSERAQAAG